MTVEGPTYAILLQRIVQSWGRAEQIETLVLSGQEVPAVCWAPAMPSGEFLGAALLAGRCHETGPLEAISVSATWPTSDEAGT